MGRWGGSTTMSSAPLARSWDRVIGNFIGVMFDGVAYGSLLFVISIGLSVTMGLMNFVNLAHGVFAMASVGLFSSVLAYIFWNRGVEEVGASVAGCHGPRSTDTSTAEMPRSGAQATPATADASKPETRVGT